MRTAEALKPRSALAASGKSRVVGDGAFDILGKAVGTRQLAGDPVADPLAQLRLRRIRLLRRRQRHDVDAAGLAQHRRIAEQFAGLAEQPRAHAGRPDQPGQQLAGGVGVEAVDRGLVARHRDLADAGRHHLALHRERGELGVDQLVLVVAEIDRAQGQQRYRHDVEQQDAPGERRITPGGAAAAQQRRRFGRPRTAGHARPAPRRCAKPGRQAEPAAAWLRSRGIGIRCHRAFRSARTRDRPRGTCAAPA